MKKKNKLLLLISILLGGIILLVFYYASRTKELTSIEKQRAIKQLEMLRTYNYNANRKSGWKYFN